MATVRELVPGDLVANFGEEAVFVARTQHPIWPTLQLVIWKLGDGRWSHDALDARQEVGEAKPATQVDRVGRLRMALLGSAT